MVSTISFSATTSRPPHRRVSHASRRPAANLHIGFRRCVSPRKCGSFRGRGGRVPAACSKLFMTASPRPHPRELDLDCSSSGFQSRSRIRFLARSTILPARPYQHADLAALARITAACAQLGTLPECHEEAPQYPDAVTVTGPPPHLLLLKNGDDAAVSSQHVAKAHGRVLVCRSARPEAVSRRSAWWRP